MHESHLQSFPRDAICLYPATMSFCSDSLLQESANVHHDLRFDNHFWQSLLDEMFHASHAVHSSHPDSEGHQPSSK